MGNEFGVLILCELNAFYFIEIAFIGFTLHEIKQCIFFFGTPGTLQTVMSRLWYLHITYQYLRKEAGS